MNENKIEVFNSAEFGTVRTLRTDDGKVLFCGVDVAKALGYSNVPDAISKHCKKDGIAKCDSVDSLGRKNTFSFITEGNVYRLITHSRLPEAERFEVWVFDEVLPEIRRTGSYGNVNIEEVITKAVALAMSEAVFCNEGMFKRLETLENKIDSLYKETRKLNKKFKNFIKSSEQNTEKIIVKSVSETAKSLVPYFDTSMKVILGLLRLK